MAALVSAGAGVGAWKSHGTMPVEGMCFKKYEPSLRAVARYVKFEVCLCTCVIVDFGACVIQNGERTVCVAIDGPCLSARPSAAIGVPLRGDPFDYLACGTIVMYDVI